MHVITFDAVQYQTDKTKDIDTQTSVSCETKISLLAEGLEKILLHKPVILDIDLDYFSTTNPFVDMYTEEQLRILSELYFYEDCESPEKSTSKRSQQLNQLKDLMSTIKTETEGGKSQEPVAHYAETDKRYFLNMKRYAYL